MPKDKHGKQISQQGHGRRPSSRDQRLNLFDDHEDLEDASFDDDPDNFVEREEIELPESVYIVQAAEELQCFQIPQQFEDIPQISKITCHDDDSLLLQQLLGFQQKKLEKEEEVNSNFEEADKKSFFSYKQDKENKQQNLLQLQYQDVEMISQFQEQPVLYLEDKNEIEQVLEIDDYLDGRLKIQVEKRQSERMEIRRRQQDKKQQKRIEAEREKQKQEKNKEQEKQEEQCSFDRSVNSISNHSFEIKLEQLNEGFILHQTEFSHSFSIEHDEVHVFSQKNQNLKKSFTRSMVKWLICAGMNKKGCRIKLKRTGFKKSERVKVKKLIRELVKDIEEYNPQYEEIDMKEPGDLYSFKFEPECQEGQEGYELQIEVEKGTPGAEYLLKENGDLHTIVELQNSMSRNRKKATLTIKKISD